METAERNSVALTTGKSKVSAWSTGLAMFAMFFGAGNIVFPLALGKFTQDKNLYAVLGLIITAVLVPLCGLLAMMLFEGDYRSFFKRIGKYPGYLVILLILALIGPFGGIPRCITISYSTIHALNIPQFDKVSLFSFSLLSCAVIYMLTFRKNRILDILGYVLTPLLLLSLVIIIAKGLFSRPEALVNDSTSWEIFSKGLIGGYNTMDLLAAFFFSSVVLVCLKKEGDTTSLKENRPLFMTAILGSLIAAVILALVYISFTYLAAGYSEALQEVPSHEMLGALAFNLMGPYAGLVAGTAVTFACITTEIALAAVFAEFFRKNICREKISYKIALLFTLGTSLLISTLNFEGISAFLGPILELCYPALIVLTLANLGHKLYNFKPVKLPVYLTFFATIGVYLFRLALT